jgi:hypothetical protein
MGERELREKYGGHLDKAINRAIRAEIEGGNEALDKLTHLAGPAMHSHWKDKQGRPTPEAAAYRKHEREVVARMEAEVRRKWGIPPAPPEKPKRHKRKGPSRPKPGTKPRKKRK